MQNIIVGVLFVGLMLIAAGIGAFAAGEQTFSMIFGIAGAAIVVIDVIFLVIYRKRRTY
ncbi:hypothetical protein ACFLTB_04185 [Chloroflexota bacterium]